jgi:hypothetical protein
MAWKVAGSYFETCSGEIVYPCTASLALGADYEGCRVTLVFNVVETSCRAASSRGSPPV